VLAQCQGGSVHAAHDHRAGPRGGTSNAACACSGVVVRARNHRHGFAGRQARVHCEVPSRMAHRPGLWWVRGGSGGSKSFSKGAGLPRDLHTEEGRL
jgi:hypothetical protein